MSLSPDYCGFGARFVLLHLFCAGLASCATVSPTQSCSHRFFNSIIAAVSAATNRYNPISVREDREFMGTVYRHGRKFGYTVSSGRTGAGASEIHVSRRYLKDVVAFWHTHGKSRPAFQYFSSADTQLVNKFGIPLYLADYTGSLKIYRPGDKTLSQQTANRLMNVLDSGFAMGSVVKDEENRTIKVNTFIGSR